MKESVLATIAKINACPRPDKAKKTFLRITSYISLHFDVVQLAQGRCYCNASMQNVGVF